MNEEELDLYIKELKDEYNDPELCLEIKLEIARSIRECYYTQHIIRQRKIDEEEAKERMRMVNLTLIGLLLIFLIPVFGVALFTLIDYIF